MVSKEKGIPVELGCRILKVSRAAYYVWLQGKPSQRMTENAEIAGKAARIHEEHPEMGHRRLKDQLEHDHDIVISDKRMLRICRKLQMFSTIKYRNQGCTKSAKDPQYTAENILNRKFHADIPNEKWLTDVTEFKWYDGIEVHKVYLSAILDLCDRGIVSYVLRDSNDNKLVFDTFDLAVERNPDAKPIFHSDRGFQYTNPVFHRKLVDQGMVQSMSRVAHCLDNGPMEGFWGILKRECYYGRRFTSRESLVQTIEGYIDYYNTQRIQRNLGILTPMEMRKMKLAA